MSTRTTKLERDYQAGLIERINLMFPGCLILKNDSGYMQGIPDWVIFYRDRYAFLEIKRKPPSSRDYQPNQEWYIEQIDAMSFAACIFPENEEEVLDGLRLLFKSRRASNTRR